MSEGSEGGGGGWKLSLNSNKTKKEKEKNSKVFPKCNHLNLIWKKESNSLCTSLLVKNKASNLSLWRVLSNILHWFSRGSRRKSLLWKCQPLRDTGKRVLQPSSTTWRVKQETTTSNSAKTSLGFPWTSSSVNYMEQPKRYSNWILTFGGWLISIMYLALNLIINFSIICFWN